MIAWFCEQEANGANDPMFNNNDFILKITVPKVTENEQKATRMRTEPNRTEQKPNRKI